MYIGYYGNPKHGYAVTSLISCIDDFFKDANQRTAVLVGVGNLGRALLSYFSKSGDRQVVAAFDSDASRTGRVIGNTHCYGIATMAEFISRNRIATGIIAVPESAAQSVCEALVDNGVQGILNFAPIRLRVPKSIFVENVDIAMSLEKVLYFSQAGKQHIGVTNG